jgi:hypothetical protein
VAATAVVNEAALTADVSAVVAEGSAGVAVVWVAAAVTVILAVVVALVSGVVVGVAVAVAAVVAVGSVVTCGVAAACAEIAWELAAIAAAAIASGAVALPEGGGGAGVLVVAVMTGSTTATGVGVVRADPACWASTVGSTAELPSVLDVDVVDVDFVLPVFEVPELPRDCWLAPVPSAPVELAPALLALASEGGPELALLLLLLFGSLLAAWLDAALFAGPELLFAGGGELSLERFAAAGGC